MDEITRATNEVYDAEAALYESTTNELDLFPGLREELDRFVDQLDCELPVLDLGSGPGRDARYFVSRGLHVVAIDISLETLRACKRSSSPASHLNTVRADMQNLPLVDGVLGGAWICASLLHAPSSQFSTILSEVHRVLAPAGVIAVSMKMGKSEGWQDGGRLRSRRWFTLIDPPELEAVLIENGFQVLASIPSGRGSWYITEAVKVNL